MRIIRELRSLCWPGPAIHRFLRAMVVMAPLALIGSDALARVQQAPSSRIAMELPEGFEPAQLFSGFTHEGLGISFVIVEMPGRAYESLAQGLTPEALESKGVTGTRIGKLERQDPHVYIRGEQASAAGTYAKFMLVFRGSDVTALITANVPKASLEAGGLKDTEIEKALASATVEATAAAAKELFRLGYLGPFKPAGNFLGTAKAYTLDGNTLGTPPPASAPLLIIAPSLDRRNVARPEEYAEQLLRGLNGPSELQVLKRAKVTYGGLEAIEIEATAREASGGTELMLYQVVLLPKEGGYFRIFGQAPLVDKATYLAELKRIAASFVLAK